ncbi:MAG TPA: hypothetical protein VFC41_09465 [Anaerovoracaceae bacterium]|nr:hypothetical protein [Anaerovoracaceae bacterium]
MQEDKIFSHKAAADSLGLANAIIGFAKIDKKTRQEYGESGKAYYDAGFSVDSILAKFFEYLSYES